MKYGELNLGQIEAIVNKLGGMKGTQRFLRGELTVSESEHRWREVDGVIYFSVTSDGTTGIQWIERLKKKGFLMGNYAESILRSSDFKPTSDVEYTVAVLMGALFEDNDRITKKICSEANRRDFAEPNAEVACLIRENFSDEEIEAMGLQWIIVMHEAIKDSDGNPYLLGAYRPGGGSWLGAYRPDNRWSCASGFAFVISQVS